MIIKNNTNYHVDISDIKLTFSPYATLELDDGVISSSQMLRIAIASETLSILYEEDFPEWTEDPYSSIVRSSTWPLPEGPEVLLDEYLYLPKYYSSIDPYRAALTEEVQRDLVRIEKEKEKEEEKEKNRPKINTNRRRLLRGDE